jgi:1,4-alpha-glucan branching enzyme
MLYLDYSRRPGEWIPNELGGRENLHAISFMRRLNEEAYRRCPGIQMVAEESTAWPMVSRPPYVGGLGFGFKWDMGWMHDTLQYIQRDPVHRTYHHHELTFRAVYAFNENFILPLSHDEVVHGKGSLLSRMPGDAWRQFANLRLLYAYMFGEPGKKLLFMGGEFAQGREWDHESSIDWNLLDIGWHKGVHNLVRDLNRLYRSTPALYEFDTQPAGVQWVELNDSVNSVLSFLRVSSDSRREDDVLVVCNFTPVIREGYRVGVPHPGYWREVLNTDAQAYQGSGVGNKGGVTAEAKPTHGRPHSVSLTLPPLGALFLKHEAK